jgi:hypothetical protein
MVPTELVSALMARRRGGRWSAANAPVKSWAGRGVRQVSPGCQRKSDERGRGEGQLTGGADRSAGAARGRGARLTGGAGVSGEGEGARCWAAWAEGGRGGGAGAREGGVAWAGSGPA